MQINDVYNQAKVFEKKYFYGELEGLSFFTPSIPMFFLTQLAICYKFQSSHRPPEKVSRTTVREPLAYQYGKYSGILTVPH